MKYLKYVVAGVLLASPLCAFAEEKSEAEILMKVASRQSREQLFCCMYLYGGRLTYSMMTFHQCHSPQIMGILYPQNCSRERR